MATLRLTRKAREDLKSIARVTQKSWGVAQRNKYLTQLDKRFALLADAPTLGLSCDAIRSGYRKYRSVRPSGRRCWPPRVGSRVEDSPAHRCAASAFRNRRRIVASTASDRIAMRSQPVDATP
jgi:plasmid stabilization system protein ParE